MKLSNNTYVGSTGRESLIDLEVPREFNGEVVVFVHGFMGFKDWGAWHLVQDYFLKHSFAFCKFNLSHNGGSLVNHIDFPDENAFGENTYSIEVDDIHCVLDWVKNNIPTIKDMHLIGHSRGGGTAILAARNLQATYSISTISTWAAISDIGTRFPSGKELNLWRKSGVRYVTNSRTKQNLPQYFNFYEDFLRNEHALTIQTALRELRIPIGIYHGEKDTSVPLAEGISLSEWAKVALQVIAGADHVFGTSHPWTSTHMPTELQELCEKTFDFITHKKRL